MFDIINASASETPQRILPKFGLNSFQVRVILPHNFELGLLSGFGGELE